MHETRRSRGLRRSRVMVLSASVCLGAGCGRDTTGPTAPSSSQLYWALHLNQYAVNLSLTAPYDTFRILATPVDPTGGVLPGGPPVTFHGSDSTVVVDSTGLVRALGVTGSAQNTQVVVTLTLQGVTHVDTMVVHVTATPPTAPLRTFSVHPVPGDSAKVAVDGQRTLTVTATDEVGTPMSFAQGNATDYVAFFRSSNPTIAKIDPILGTIQPNIPGHVTFIVTTWAYGVARQDSVPYVIGYSIYPGVGVKEVHVLSRTPLGSTTPYFYFMSSLDTIGVGGAVRFGNSFLHPVDIVFEDSAAISGGNIPAFPGVKSFDRCGLPLPPIGYCLFDSVVTRGFPTAGIYHFHSPLIGASGTIVVSAGP